MKLALFQGEAKVGDVSFNLSKMQEQMSGWKDSVGDGGAALMVFPELFLTGYSLEGEEMKRLAEDKQGPSFQQLSATARELGIAVLYGYPEVDMSSGTATYYNSAQLIDSDGRSLLNYHKTHLWIDDAGYERAFTAGSELSEVVECCGVKVGVLICYDVEFPEAVRVLALRGAKVVLVPTAVRAEFQGMNISETIVPARAMENRVYVVYVNHAGSDWVGQSVCCDPFGNTVAKANTNGETMLYATVTSVPLLPCFDFLSNRRPNLYKELTVLNDS